MQVISVANQKGGVAKTTTAFMTALTLHDRGSRVLAVDLDPQSNFTFSAGLDTIGREKTLFDVFKGLTPTREIISTSPLGFDLLPGGLALAGADMDFTQTGREYMLKEAISSIGLAYDFVVIDTPPTLGILTINALTASDKLIIPATADVYALQGISQLYALIENVRKYCNPGLEISGILITKYNARVNISKAMVEQIESAASKINTIVFQTRIKETVSLREAALIQDKALKAVETTGYTCFVDELLKGDNYE